MKILMETSGTHGFLTTPLNLMAEMRAPEKIPSYEWRQSGTRNRYAHVAPFTTQEEALAAIQGFQLPADILDRARRNSRKLVALMAEHGAPRTVRRQATGRLDGGTLIRRWDDIRSGRATDTEARIYKRREMTAPKRPHVAIVADGCWGKMWGSHTYIPRVAEIALGITWACQALQLETTAALTQGFHKVKRVDNKTVKHTTSAIEIDVRNTRALSLFFHRDLYRNGYMTAWGHDETIIPRLGTKSGNWKYTSHEANFGSEGPFTSTAPGHSVAWARHRGADLVIAMGANDADDADIAIDPSVDNLDAAFDAIAAGIAKLKRR